LDVVGVPGVPGTCGVDVLVVTFVIAEYAELPALLVARTRYRYVVFAANPESLNEFDVGVPTWVNVVLVAPVARSTW